MTAYCICPEGLKNAVEYFDLLGIRFDAIVSSPTDDCLLTAMHVYNKIATAELPIPTDLLNEKGDSSRPPVSELTRKHPLISFDGMSAVCDIISYDEPHKRYIERVRKMFKFAMDLNGNHLFVVRKPVYELVNSW
jgi:hypothetical protein